MGSHIVKPNETISDILNIYQVSIAELSSANPHFRSWDNLAPGVRIKIPEITKNLEEEIERVEPFIEDYYPSIDTDVFSEVDKTYEMPYEKKVNKSKNMKPQYYYPYYYYPYYYRRNNR